MKDAERQVDPDAPDESTPGHHPDPEEPEPPEDPPQKEDRESDQSFPASDPPANY